MAIVAALPVLAPVAFIDPPVLGIRAASVVNVVLLFAVGHSWAPYAGLSKMKVGITLAAIGTAVILATISLGG